MDNKEEWRPVVGYEDKYEVSSYGCIRNKNTGYVLRQRQDKDGYMMVSLYDHQKGKVCFAHRLVAQAFIENIDGLPYVNHKDENKSNNRVDNLEWCDARYNTMYGTARERAKITKHRKTILKRELEKKKRELEKKKLEESWAKIEKITEELMKKLKI